VSFQSSHNNVAGEYVSLVIFANVWSRRLKEWRREHFPILAEREYVAGGQIGNLVEPHSWLEWNLADAAQRDAEMRDAEEAIRRLALPYFAAFDDVPGLCARLLREDLPSMGPWDTFDSLACFASLNAARASAIQFPRHKPKPWDDYRFALERFGRIGLPDYVPSAHAEILALLSFHYRLGDLTQS
jgi:hypothetical protein